ncbi:MAG: CHAT domain-containing protein, partial [Bacteroidetes bacterium]
PTIARAQGQRLCMRYDLQQVGSSRELIYATPKPTTPPQEATILACISYPTDTVKMANRTRECIGQPGNNGRKGSDGTPEPLPGTLNEADTVASRLRAVGTNVTVWIGYEPLEEDIKMIGRSGPSPEFMLFTTHGFAWDTLPIAFKGRFPRNNPMYSSGLQLAGSEDTWVKGQAAPGFQDGILTAREVSLLDLSGTRLVILSACQSGLGNAESSEGVYGLQRAFKIAGVDQVLVTLWEIPDSPETVEFIGQFCQRWLTTGDARAALKDTQRAFAEKKGNVQVWAAWTLI